MRALLTGSTRSGSARLVFGFVNCLTLIGCSENNLDSGDTVKTLRVLGVQAQQPYAPPTTDPANPTRVEFTMLSHDGIQAPDLPARSIERIWFSGCEDLPGDLYYKCFPRIAGLWKLYTQTHSVGEIHDGMSWSPVDDLVASTPAERNAELLPLLRQVNSTISPDLAEAYLRTYRIGVGNRFEYPVPPLVIENHMPSTDPSVPSYGSAFVFFTLCAGYIKLNATWATVDLTSDMSDSTLGFPFDCLSDEDQVRGPDDYVAGYTQEVIYAGSSTNKNPVIDGVKFNGQTVDPSAYCLDGDCVPETAIATCDTPTVPHVPACSGENCTEYEWDPLLDAAKNNEADLFQPASGTTHGEQMWVDFYIDRGSLTSSITNLRDATLGWFDNHSTKWTAPQEKGLVNLWVVVHDNRSGTSWLRMLVCVD